MSTNTRKKILPVWIRIFSYIFLLGFVTPIIFLIGIFGGIVEFTAFGLAYEGTSLNPIAIWCTIIMTLSAIVAYGILWGKVWAVRVGIIYGYLGIATCVAAFIIRLQESGELYFALESLLLIPFIFVLTRNKAEWESFTPETEETT